MGQFHMVYPLIESINSLLANANQWNVIISGFAQAGRVNETFKYFDKLAESGCIPNDITFLSLLQVCANRGEIEKGKDIYTKMEYFNVKPSIAHYNCYVDLLARSNHLEEALTFIDSLSIDEVNFITWASLLGGCKKHRNVKIGELCFDKIQEIDASDPAHYITMANLYSSVGMDSEATRIRQMMKDRGLSKIPGQSVLEIDGIKHTFMVNDTKHPDYDLILKELNILFKEITKAGYKPNVSVVTNLDLKTETEKVQLLCSHSEKLAIAYALMKTEPNAPITISQNLRVCIDCHEATKYISKVRNRQITVRDQKVFHVFENGKCSCGDFW